ncbi:PAS domain-containing protein [Fulvivirgaceae bacterium LMO-SS25]
MNLHKDTILLFNANPEPSLLLASNAPIFTILAVNNAYLNALGIEEKVLVGNGIFEVFPDSPSNSPSPLYQSLHKVIGSKSIDSILQNRYDILNPRSAQKETKYWKISNSPILKESGEIDYILHTVTDKSKEVIQSEIKDLSIEQKARLLATSGLFASALLSNESWEDALKNAFSLIGEAVDADRVYYFENFTDKATGNKFTSQVMEWCNEKVVPQSDNPNLQNAAFEDFKEFFEPLLQGKIYIKNTQEVEDNKLRLLLESMAIKSVLIMPIYIDSYFHGFIGFDDCHNNRNWTDEEIEFLTSIASNLTIAIDKKQKSEAFAESQQRLQSAINNSPGVIYRCKADKNWTATFISNEIERITGYPASDFINNSKRSFASIIHQEDNISEKELEKMLNDFNAYSYQCRIICKDGTIKWVEDRGTGIYDVDGNLAWIDGLIIDITDRKHIDEKYKAIVDHTSDAIMLADNEGKYVAVNAAATFIFGYSESEFLQMSVDDLLLSHPEIDFGEIWEDFKSKDSSSGNMDLLTKYGKTISVSYKAKANVLPGLHLSVITDITEATKKELELKASERRFKALVQEGSDLISIINEKGEFTFISESTSASFGISTEDFIGTQIFQYIHENERPTVIKQFKKLFKQKKLKLDPYRLIDGEGGWRWITTTGINLLQDQVVNGIVTNSKDITEIVEKETALKRANTRYELAQKATTDAIWDLDIATGELNWGEGYKNIFGYPDILYQYDQKYLDRRVHPDDVEWVANSFRNAINDPAKDIWSENYKYYKFDGSLAYVSNKGFISRDVNGKAIRAVGSLSDISAAKNREIQTELMHSLTYAFNKTNEFKESLDEVLTKISEFFKISISEAWVTSIDKKNINLISQIITDNKGQKFAQLNSSFTTLTIGKGLIGKSWESGKIEKWNIKENKKDFLREKSARQSKLENSYAVPIKYNDQVIAVFNFIGDFKEVNLAYFEEILLGISEQIGTEVLRKMREEELHNFFELSSDILIIAGFDGYFKKINPALSKLLGYSKEELLSRPFTDFIHPEDINQTRTIISKALKGEVIYDFEVRYLKKNGEIVWITWTTTPKLSEGLLYAVGKDITERKSIELEILKANEQLKTAQDIAVIGYWSREINSDISHWSSKVYEIYEQDPETFVPTNENLKELFHPEDRLYLEEDLTNHFSTDGYHDFEHRILIDGKKEKWVFQRIKLKRDSKGNPILIDGVIQDITLPKTREIQLKISNERFEMAMKATNEMIWDWDIKNDYVTRSQGYESIFGFKFDDISSVQSFWLQNIYKDDSKAVRISLNEALENPETKQWHKEYRFVKANGDIAFIADRGHIIRNEKGQAIRMIGAVLDVTESRKLLKEITIQNHALKEIAWTQSHVVRAPLSRLLGFISLIELNLFDNEDEYFTIMNGIKTSAEELDEIVKNIVAKTNTLK